MTTEEMYPINQFLVILIEAAKREEWDKVDKKLVPQLAKFEGNQMARELLRYKDDEDPNVRDVVATSLTPIAITDERTRSEAIEAMIRYATTDEERYPAGRGAFFLLKHQKDENYEEKIENALRVFKERVEKEGWGKDLAENIPELEEFLQH